MAFIFPKSSALLLFLHPTADRPTNLRAVGTMPGTVITRIAHKNGLGRGAIRSSGDGTLFSWKAPGSLVYGPSVDVSALGTYALEDGEDSDKWIHVETVSVVHLPKSAVEEPIYVFSVLGGRSIAGDVPDGQAGDVDTYQLLVVNAAAGLMSDLRVWLDPATMYFELAFGASGWVSPTTFETGLVLGTLGDVPILLDVRRTVPPLTGPDPKVTTVFHFGFNLPT